MSKVLFVIKNLGIGGSTTSLLNMLELLDKSGNKVDLYAMEHDGMFIESASKCANILPESKKLASAICKSENVKNYGWNGIINRCFVSLGYKVKKANLVREHVYKQNANKVEKYDVVIAYQEGITTNFARFVPAKKRIAWVHTIYERFAVNSSHDEMLAVYSAFDEIVCVAPAAVVAFQSGLPELRERVHLIPNPLNSEQIKEKAALPQSDILDEQQNIIVSVGRLSPEKQYDLAIHTARMLDEYGIMFRWLIIGAGSEKEKLETLIKEKALGKKVILLGARENPYSIMAKADVLVISSLYEAQPMVANEALILDVPVITTDYPSAKTLVIHERNGLICTTSANGLYTALKDFFTDESLKMKLKHGAMDYEYDSNSIVKKVLDMCLYKKFKNV